MEARYIPKLVVLELTRRCILSCIHCRASINGEDTQELSLQDWLGVLDDISSLAKPIIILSGGEALLREDIFEIISYICKKDLTPVLATCGVTLTEERADLLNRAGIKRVSVSIDGKDAATHEMIRQSSGIFEKAILALKILKAKGIEFQVNTMVSRHNFEQLEDIFEIAKNYEAVSFHPFFLVPVGRARRLKDMQLSGLQHEEALNWLYKKSKESSISCRPTCAPQYFRILNQNNFKETSLGLDAKTKGCLAGKSFCFISSSGKVYPCGFLEKESGDIRKESFVKVWKDSIVFNHLRDLSKYKGKCGECEFLNVCGGCRARAYAETGDYLQEEPECSYQPSIKKP